jgi:Flp pilus assembly protein TadB
MLFGVILLICGILIAVYPPLLSLVVAVVLMAVGTILCVVSYRFKKTAKHLDDPFLDFFIKM